MKLKESKKINEGKVKTHDLTKMNQNGRKVMLRGLVKKAHPGMKIWVDNNQHYMCKGNGMWEYGERRYPAKMNDVLFELGFEIISGKVLYVEL